MRIKIFLRIKRALNGFFLVASSDTSVRKMCFIGIIILAFAFWFNISRMEMIVVVAIIIFVISLEGINTILERVIDLVEPRYKSIVREIKDALAGIVLFASAGAAIIGILVFWPYIVEKFC
jgi:undecaprenol kinase